MRKKDKINILEKKLYSVEFVISGSLCKCDVIARTANEAIDEMFKVYPLATMPGAKLIRQLKADEALKSVGIMKKINRVKNNENNKN